MTTSAPLLDEPLPVELMNTVWADRDGVHDALASAPESSDWLTAIAPRCELTRDGQLAATTPADAERLAKRLRALRNALRRLAAEATRDPRTAATSTNSDLATAVAEVNAAAAGSPRWSALDWSAQQTPTRSTQTSGSIHDALLAEIAEDGVALIAGPVREQLRACLAPGCVLYFVKTHPRREWCSDSCGNRARVARHYERRRQFSS